MKKQKENDKKAQEPVAVCVDVTEERDELVRLPDRLADEVVMHVNKGKLAQKIREQQEELEEVIWQRNEVEKDLMRLREYLVEKEQQITDFKKTISKMKQQHEAEVADLKDRIMEAEAEANAIRKSKEEVIRERLRYADDLDNDSIAFEEILQLAVLMERGAKSMHEVSKMIQAKTEGRV